MVPLDRQSATIDRQNITGLGEHLKDGSGQLIEVDSIEGDILTLNLDQVTPYSRQPRKYFDPKKIQNLALDLQENGQDKDIKVAPYLDADGNVKFVIVDGERRYRACQLAGITTINAKIQSYTNETDLYAEAVRSFNFKEDLGEIEKAEMIARMVEDEENDQNRDQSVAPVVAVAARLKIENSSVYNYIKIHNLPEPIKQYLIDKKMPLRFVLLLANRNNSKKMEFPTDAVLEEMRKLYERNGKFTSKDGEAVFNAAMKVSATIEQQRTHYDTRLNRVLKNLGIVVEIVDDVTGADESVYTLGDHFAGLSRRRLNALAADLEAAAEHVETLRHEVQIAIANTRPRNPEKQTKKSDIEELNEITRGKYGEFTRIFSNQVLERDYDDEEYEIEQITTVTLNSDRRVAIVKLIDPELEETIRAYYL